MYEKPAWQISAENEQADINRGDLLALILGEQLILKGIAALCHDLTESEEIGSYDKVSLSSISLWMLGEVVDRTQSEIDRKLTAAGRRFDELGLGALLKRAKGAPTGDTSGSPLSMPRSSGRRKDG